MDSQSPPSTGGPGHVGHRSHEELLGRGQFSDIEKEYNSFDRPPHWFQLFGGPSSIQQLAYRLAHHSQYDFLYRQWSTVAHAHDFSQFLAVAATGESGIRGIRDVTPMQQVSRFAATFMVEATRRILLEFCPREPFADYYNAELREAYLEVMSRNDFFSSVPVAA